MKGNIRFYSRKLSTIRLEFRILCRRLNFLFFDILSYIAFHCFVLDMLNRIQTGFKHYSPCLGLHALTHTRDLMHDDDIFPAFFAQHSGTWHHFCTAFWDMASLSWALMVCFLVFQELQNKNNFISGMEKTLFSIPLVWSASLYFVLPVKVMFHLYQ